MADKKRLDQILVDQGLVPTRAKARSAIMAGQVLVGEQVVDKAGTMFPETAQIKLKGQPSPFVSRGGLKLAKALKEFDIDLTGRIILDVGASTGGFTDCSLKAGASLVYAVDVGYGQLAWELRTNPAVINLERTNIRHLEPEALSQGSPSFCCIDVAFISLRLVLPTVAKLLVEPAELVMLIKPQFEAGREQIGKKGVVRDPLVHVDVVDKVLANARDLGFGLWNLDYSPIQGPQGNIEYLAHGSFQGEERSTCSPQEVVKAAHSFFNG